MNLYSVLARINGATSMKELDRIAIDIFSDVEDGKTIYHQDISMAIQKKESELLAKINEAVEEELNGTVCHLVHRKNTQPTDPEIVVDVEPIIEDITLDNVQCGCVQKYGISCIHKTSFKGIVPEDYQECQTCGCDHKYDPRLAKEVHDRIDSNR